MPGLNYTVNVDGRGIKVLQNFNRELEKANRLMQNSKISFESTGRSANSFNNYAKKLISSLFSFKSLIISIAGGAGLGLLAKSFITVASTTEQYQIRLETLLGSTKEANRLFKDMSDFAGKVPFTYNKIMESATALTGVMKGGVDEVNKWIPLIADLAAASGLSIEQTTSQVIRMYSAGAQAADTFRERGILSMLGFQAGVSYTTEETIDQMFKAWDSADSRFKGATDKLANTWAGGMSMLSDAWFQFKDAVAKEDVFETLKKGLNAVLDEIKTFKKEGKFDEWAKGLATVTLGAFDLIFKMARFVFGYIGKVQGAYARFWLIPRLDKVTKEFEKYTSLLSYAERKLIENFTEGTRAFEKQDKKLEKIREKWRDLQDTIKLYNEKLEFTATIQEWGEETAKAIDSIRKKIKDSGKDIKKTNDDILTDSSKKFISSLSDMENKLTLFSNNKMSKKLTEFKPELLIKNVDDAVEEFDILWEYTAKSFENAFTEAFRNIIRHGEFSFSKLGDSILDIFADVTADLIRKNFIAPVIEQAIMNFRGIPGTVGTVGQQQLAKAVPFIGAGAGIYSLTQQAQAGQLSVGGGMAQGALSGALIGSAVPVIGTGIGALAGGLIGGITSVFSDEEEKLRPRVKLMFEEIDGHIKIVGQRWKDTARDPQLVESIQTFYQEQIDFYKQLGFMVDKSSLDLTTIELGSELKDIQEKMLREPIKFAILFSDLIEETFGQESIDKMEALWADLFKVKIPIKKPISPEAELQKIREAEDPMKAFEALMERRLGPGNFFQLKQFIMTDKAIDDWKEFISTLEFDVDNFNKYFTTGLGNVFKNALETGAFSDFEDGLKVSIFSNIKNALSDAFIKTLTEKMFQPLFEVFGFGGILTKYMEGLTGEGGGPTLTDVISDLEKSFSEIDLTAIQPIFETFSAGIQKLNESILENTSATTSNTSAIIGPINDFLDYLSGQQTGGANLSLGQITEQMGTLYNEALLGMEGFRVWSDFIKREVVPSREGLPGFEQQISTIKGQTIALPYYQEALQQNKNITVKVYIGNEELKNSTIEILQDPDVKQVMNQ